MRPLGGVPAGIWLPATLIIAAAPVEIVCLRHWLFDQYCAVFLLQIILYAIAAWALLKPNPHPSTFGRRALIAILIVAGLLRLIALCAPVYLSSDAFRYVWDGRVQAAGINPYHYIPADPQLSFLRDKTIYPDINRADYAHTIYPPAAQIGFFVFERISDSLMGMKLGMLACDGLSIGCLIALLRERGLPAARVLLYAWHPLPIWEFAGMGHVDAIAIALLLLSFLLAARRAPVWTGIALAAATLVKYYPIIAAPALYRRWDWRMPLAVIATMVLLYLPYISAGVDVLGFMPGYVNEEGLRSGSGFFLWALLERAVPLPSEGIRYYLPFAAIAMGALAAWVQFGRSRISKDASGVLGTYVLASAFVLLFSPHNAWYFAWLVPFLCFRFSIAHLWLTSACVLIYTQPDPFGLDLQLLLYLPFMLLLIMQYGLARHRANLPRHLPESIDAEPVNRHGG
jgi:alpha-1,6-mannosyltransferase